MLKTADLPPPPPPGSADRSIGELASKLVDDAKAYAKAEVSVAKAIAGEKADAVKVPLVLIIASVFVAMGALNALCIAIVLALATLMGPLLAGLLAFVLVGAVAGIMAWIGYSKLRDAL
ncbi:MAG TPA: phage holin family protein [Sphingomicrobium sp.]|nr:phage holin family protein [Sphingomicrobium sp.]